MGVATRDSLNAIMPFEGPRAVCPGCGGGVDRLRAGHVAIVDGRFEYFCGADCKRSFSLSRGAALGEDIATAEPPAVMPEAPEQSPAAPPVPAASEEGRKSLLGDNRQALLVLDASGLISGTLAALAQFLGDTGEAVGVPLALWAWIALAVRIWRAGRDPADPHPGVVLLPTALATGAAVWARWVGDPRAAAATELAGIACATCIVVERVVASSREHVTAARRRIEQALAVPVRMVQGGLAAPSEVRSGENVVVEAGETIGVDAVVCGGKGQVVPWLGAGYETFRREGDPVVAGARLVSGRLVMTTTWAGAERAWVRLLSSARARVDVAAPTARGLRQVIEWGTPIAGALVGLASISADAPNVQIVASLAAGAIAAASKPVPAFVALLFARAHLRALRNGITYRDAASFERAAATEVAVLSARGTILLGEPEIVAVEPVGPYPTSAGDGDGAGREERIERVLSLAAGAETGQTHPFATAVLRAASARGIAADHVRNANSHSGLGVSAIASSGERLVVGGRAIMLAEKIGGAVAEAHVSELEAQGRSVLLVALGERLIGLIALQDGMRPRARAAVQKLLDAGIEPVLLSGEARDTCETIGRALDIEHVRPEVLPADRRAEVLALGEGGSVVAVVGHPLRDEGALGAADVAVAMDAAGATPGEWSVALASDDVAYAAEALAIPRAARRRARLVSVVGLVPGLLALLALGFGVAPLASAPLALLLSAVATAAFTREPTGDSATE
jgi:Cu+-exporting ATPase